MIRIAVIAVYFGNLPGYFNLWKKSCEYNPTIDFYLFTDQELTNVPENLNVVATSLQETHKLINNKLGCTVSLERPYKLCDYKPMYGLIFEDYLQGYDYWGHCDLDMVFGDLRSFFDKYHIENYDRFMHLGHLSLYKNIDSVNNSFKLDGSNCGSWKDVISTDKSCLFDEWSGIYQIYKKNNLPIFDQRIFADISEIYHRFRLALDDKNYDYQIFYWENGHIFREYIENNKFGKEEFIYIHFKRRQVDNHISDIEKENAFYIGSEGFYEKTSEVTQDIINKYNPFKGENYEKSELKQWSSKQKQKRWKSKLARIIRKQK